MVSLRDRVQKLLDWWCVFDALLVTAFLSGIIVAAMVYWIGSLF